VLASTLVYQHTDYFSPAETLGNFRQCALFVNDGITEPVSRTTEQDIRPAITRLGSHTQHGLSVIIGNMKANFPVPHVSGDYDYAPVTFEGLVEIFLPLNKQGVKHLFVGHEGRLKHFRKSDPEIHEDTSAEISDIPVGPLGVTKLNISLHKPSVRYGHGIENKSQQPP
jgi:hypothetical protein